MPEDTTRLDTFKKLTTVNTDVTQEGDEYVIKRSQDVSGILEDNKEAFNNYSANTKEGGMGRRIASVPFVIVEQWLKEGINVMNPSENDRVKMMAKLNSNEYQFLRTAPGHY